MRAVKTVTIDSERRVIITFLDGSTEALLPELIYGDAEVINSLSEQVGDLKSAFNKSLLIDQLFNATDILNFGTREDVTRNKVVFRWNADGSCTVTTQNGEPASNTGYCDFFSSKNSLPDWIIPGIEYTVSFSGNDVQFRVLAYENGASTTTTIYNSKEGGTFTIPETATGLIIRLSVPKNSIPNETVDPHIFVGVSNKDVIRELNRLNCGNLLDGLQNTNVISNGVTFAWNGNELHADGTPTDTAFVNVFKDKTAMPNGFVLGKTYNVKYSSSKIYFRVYWYDNQETLTNIVDTKTDASFTIPTNAVGLLIRYAINTSAGAVDETVEAFCYDADNLSNSDLTEISKHLFEYRGLPNSNDLNDFVDPGTYFLSTATPYDHCPIRFSRRRVLTVEGLTNGVKKHEINDMTFGQKYIRLYYDDAWHDWIDASDIIRKTTEVFDGFILSDYLAGSVDIMYDAGTSLLNRAVSFASNRSTTANNGFVTCSPGERYIIAGKIKGTLHPDAFEKIVFRVYFQNGESYTSKTLDAKSGGFVVPAGYTSLTVAGNAVLSQSPSENLTETIAFDYVLLKVANNNKVIYPEKLKLCTYNVGLYNYGYSGSETHPRQNIGLKNKMFRKFLANNDFDIMCCQENYNASVDEIVKMYDAFSLMPYWFQGNTSETMSSKYILGNKQQGYFSEVLDWPTGTHQRGWMLAEIYVKGLKIAIFNCHPEYLNNESGAATRQIQYAEIINSILADYDDAILFGDWNAYSIDEFDIFKNAGYTILNGGYLGTQYSKPAMGTPIYPLDNIILKGQHLAGFAMLGDNLHDPEHPDDENYYVSDHIPLVAEVTVY